MARLLIAYVLAFVVGMLCKYFGIPAPAPPVIPGALLVVAMTLGYSAGGKLLPRKDSPTTSSTTISSSLPADGAKEIQK